MELSNEIVEKIVNAEAVDVKADDNGGKFEVIASTETPDRAWESIIVKGWDLKNYKKSPIILFWHDYWDIKNVIWKATSITKTNDNWQAVLKAKWVFSNTEQWQTARQLYDEWILKTVSVWFRVLERDEGDRSIITKAELLEISFVPVPCNPEALAIEKGLIQKWMDLWLLTKDNWEDEEDEKDIDENDTLEKRLDKIEWVVKNINESISDIKSYIMEKKEVEQEKPVDDKTEEMKKAMEKMAVVVNTALNKFKK